MPRKPRRICKLSLGTIFVAANFLSASAAVTMPRIFGDHMVLQESVTIPIWGWAAPGEEVTVILGDHSATVVAAQDGSWRVDLPPMAAAPGAPSTTLTVQGTKNQLVFQDVLLGDVWVASGQSNMAFGVKNDARAAATLATANEPSIRLFYVPTNISLEPLKDIKPGAPDTLEGKWLVCSPETLGGKMGWGGFSAAAYYFGRDIHHDTGRPVGLIGTYWGGTSAQAWTSLSGLQKDPTLARYVADRQKVVDHFAQAQTAYPKLEADYLAAQAAWTRDFGQAYDAAMAKWRTDAAQALAAGAPFPPQPQPGAPKPKAPLAAAGNENTPANLYNAMVAPVIPYAIKGVIWYQGEQNSGDGEAYAPLFARLITDWRDKWGQGDFPFVFVQLANYLAPQKDPSEGGWANIRDAQLQALALPHTAMAVIIDIGSPFNIHPTDKYDVGHRLALAARWVAYGEDLFYSGPLYDTFKVEGNKIRVIFKNPDEQLKIGVSPLTPDCAPLSALTGFAVAGADRKWFWADAVIDGATLVISNNDVPAPVAVRYDWASDPKGNLYNQAGLPASPFRTDHWDSIEPK